MTWSAFHRRGDVLRDVVDAVDARRDGVLPMDLPGVAETFRDELDLISALGLRWHARLSGNIERELMREPMDLEGAVAAAWNRTSRELPGIRMILDRYAAEPVDADMAVALARAGAKELTNLAVAAGLASDTGARAAEAGQRLLDRARDLPDQTAAEPAPAVAPDERHTPSLVERIRAVLAA